MMEAVMAMWGGQPRAMRWASTAGVVGGMVGGWGCCGGGRGRVGSMVEEEEEEGLGYWGSRFEGGEGREEVWVCVGGGGCGYL